MHVRGMVAYGPRRVAYGSDNTLQEYVRTNRRHRQLQSYCTAKRETHTPNYNCAFVFVSAQRGIGSNTKVGA